MLDEIKKILIQNKEEIINVLKEIEPEKVALEEYNLSISALDNNDKYIKKNVNIISSYMPMNLPLYSIIIYVVVPKICSNKSYYRPATKTLNQSKRIHELLCLDAYDIKLFDGTRFDYQKGVANKSDVVIFVGKSENANKISKELSENSLFIYFGVGQNPAVITNNANLEKASKKIAETIMFNYGQDCAKPNVILCQRDLHDEFVKKLIVEIEKNFDQKTTIKDLRILREVADLLVRDINYIKYGGDINFKEKTLNPVIITKELQEDNSNYNEYYAPIFRVMLYDNINDLKKYFSNKIYKKENMNISLFGESDFISNLPSSLVLHDEMVPEIDNGYCEYGGYGENTSYLSYHGVKIIKPILINREIEYFLNNKNFVKLSDSLNKNDSNKAKLNSILFGEYNNYVHNLFRDNLEFAFIFGSYAKGNPRMSSDIDIFVCLKKVDKEKIKKFREWYFKFHYMYGKTPDFYYPGEILTIDKLNHIINNNKNIKFKIQNSVEVFDSLFYTQIFTDKKKEIIGNKSSLLKYEIEMRKFVPDFCNQIYELLKNNNMIENDRDNMKCLIAQSSNDLLFFGERLNYDTPEDEYTDIAQKLDDGFLVKCLKKQYKV